MLAGVPVLAANTGGPLETVVEGQTGWLRDVEDVNAWTDVMGALVEGNITEEELRRIGENGRRRVRGEFSKEKMAKSLDGEIERMMQGPRRTVVGICNNLWGVWGLVGGFIAVSVWAVSSSKS